MKFTKMHGLGNDYVYVNCFEEKIDIRRRWQDSSVTDISVLVLTD